MQKYLEAFSIPARISHRLVRGLDYYTRTTFEILGAVHVEGDGDNGAGELGAQNALLGGGRYDGLVKDLGGSDRPGIGFAAGLERLVLALPESASSLRQNVAFIVAIGDEGRPEALKLLAELRAADVPALMEFEARGVRAQMKRADRIGASVTLIVGGDELARGEVTVRDMKTGDQKSIPRAAVLETVRLAM